MKTVIGRIFAGRAARMFVARWTDAEFAQAGLGMHRMILPVTIAADDEEIVRHIGFEPLAQLVALVLES